MRSSVLDILEITMMMVMNDGLKFWVEPVAMAERVPNARALIYLSLTDYILSEWSSQVDVYSNSWPEGIFCILTAVRKVLFLSSFRTQPSICQTALKGTCFIKAKTFATTTTTNNRYLYTIFLAIGVLLFGSIQGGLQVLFPPPYS